MPTFSTGKGAQFTIEDAAATQAVRDISNVLNQIDFPRTVDTGETTSFGASQKSYIPALSDATISISGSWDPTVDGYLGTGVEPASRGFVYAPVNLSGNPKYSGECIMTAYSGAVPVGDTITFSASFQVTGAITRASI